MPKIDLFDPRKLIFLTAPPTAGYSTVRQCIAAYGSVEQRIAACGSVQLCIAAYSSVEQRVAAYIAA